MTLKGMFSRSNTKKRPPSSITRLQTVLEPGCALTPLRKADQEEETKVEEGEQNDEEYK